MGGVALERFLLGSLFGIGWDTFGVFGFFGSGRGEDRINRRED